MNILKEHFINKAAGAILMAIVAFGTAAGQDSTVKTLTNGQPYFDTQVTNAEVVYVEGNDLVLKLEDGKVEHLVVPDTDKFTIDGKDVSVKQLVPGTKLTQTITTKTTPRYVKSVRTIQGKVFYVNAPNSVILTLPDNTNQVYDVPDHAKFIIDGEEKTVFDLRKGMNVNATVVTHEEETIVTQTKMAYGQAPQIATPQTGTLLFLTPKEPQVTLASAETPAETLPETGSAVPFVGLLGILTIGMAFALAVARRANAL